MRPAKMIKSLLKRGMTEQQIADKIGINQSTVNRLKNGQHHTLHFTPGMRLTKLYQNGVK